jgi:hypothetical protein
MTAFRDTPTMKAVRTSEMSVYFHETTRRYIPEGFHLHTRRLENLNSHFFTVVPKHVFFIIDIRFHGGEYEDDSLLGYCAV